MAEGSTAYLESLPKSLPAQSRAAKKEWGTEYQSWLCRAFLSLDKSAVEEQNHIFDGLTPKGIASLGVISH